MSKMDGLRAMREARHAEAAKRTPRAKKPLRLVDPSTPEGATVDRAPVAPALSVAELPEQKLCGHRAISGKTCTREDGHAAKSHRYS